VVSRNIHLLNLMANFLHQHVRRAAVEMALTVSPRRPSLLSPRETQVLEWAARGQSTREISAGLGISPKGVDFHIDGAKHKLRASNRTHAVAKAITLGLLSADI
jgi:DNA-binding CsgD family transcriptional regulator